MEQQNALINKNDFSKDKTRILIVDDHPIVRRGLIQLINREKGLIVCGEAESAHKAMDAVKKLQPDMAIVDISLKGSSGIELIKYFKIHYPKLPVLVVSMHDEAVYAERVLRAGARGYVMKQEATEKVAKAIHQVLNKGTYLSDKMASKIMFQFIDRQSIKNFSPDDLLSDRELEVYHFIGQGYKTSRIAEELCLSIKTIETYRANIKSKLKLKNSVELVQNAVQWIQQKNPT